MHMNEESIGIVGAQYEIVAGPYAAGELDVRSFRAEEAVSRTFALDVLVATTADAEGLEDELLGAAARFTLHGPDGASRAIDGVVTQVRAQEDLLPHERHQARLRIEPRLSLAALRRNTRIFQSLPVTDIVDAVLREHDVACEWRLDNRYPERTYCVQYAETDLEFVQRLLAEEGIFYVFAEPTGGPGEREVIVCLDAAEGYVPMEGNPTLAYQPAEGVVGGAEHVHRFKFERRVRSGAVTLHDYDFARPFLDLTSKERAAEPARRIDERALEVYQHHGEHHDPDVRRSLARAMLGGLRADAAVGTGRSGCRRLCPGRVFHLAEHEVAKLNQAYAVTSVTHEGHRDEHRGESEARGERAKPNYVNRFECVPADVAWREPPPARRSSQVVETAVVVGPPGEEIYTDAQGRVKVQFHWDREGQRNEHSSCWIRVAQTWAGAGWGFQFVPRVGMEVLVTFLGGDLDRPLVTGCVFNGEHPLPYALPQHKSRSGIKTSSTPGGGGSNELRFEDAAGREQLYLHAQRDLDAVVENNRSDVVHGHEIRTVDKNRSRTVRGHETVAIGHSQRVSVEGDHVRSVKGNEVVTVHKNLVLHIVGRQMIQVDGRDPEDEDEDEGGEGSAEQGAVDEEGAPLDSTRIPAGAVLASMIATPRVAEAMSVVAAEPRVAEALEALSGQARLVEVISTVAGEPHVAAALTVLGGKTTAALLLRARSLGRNPAASAATLVNELRPETAPITEGVADAIDSAARRAGGVERGGGAGKNFFTREADPANPTAEKKSVMTILGGGEISAPDGFTIKAGGSYIKVEDGGITIHGPLVTIEGTPIKLNC
jgi:type VI secretion system secreted protein VgrG